MRVSRERKSVRRIGSGWAGLVAVEEREDDGEGGSVR